jgi:hypothetical protein
MDPAGSCPRARERAVRGRAYMLRFMSHDTGSDRADQISGVGKVVAESRFEHARLVSTIFMARIEAVPVSFACSMTAARALCKIGMVPSAPIPQSEPPGSSGTRRGDDRPARAQRGRNLALDADSSATDRRVKEFPCRSCQNGRYRVGICSECIGVMRLWDGGRQPVESHDPAGVYRPNASQCDRNVSRMRHRCVTYASEMAQDCVAPCRPSPLMTPGAQSR